MSGLIEGAGNLSEERIDGRNTEFPSINARHAGRFSRYAYTMSIPKGRPLVFDGIVKQDVQTGAEKRVAFGDGVFGSESPMAPRIGSQAEDDGYLVTFTTDLVNDCRDALILTAQDLDLVARIRLPERISSGTHSFWHQL